MAPQRKRQRVTTHARSSNVANQGVKTRSHRTHHQTPDEDSPMSPVSDVSSQAIKISLPQSKSVKSNLEGHAMNVNKVMEFRTSDLSLRNAELEKENGEMKVWLKQMVKRDREMELYYCAELDKQQKTIRELEDDVWTTKHSGKQTSDGVFNDRMQFLAQHIQDFVVNTFRDCQLVRHVTRSDVWDEVLGAIPQLNPSQMTNKFLIVQAVMAVQLMRILQCGSCEGVPFDSILKFGYTVTKYLNDIEMPDIDLWRCKLNQHIDTMKHPDLDMTINHLIGWTSNQIDRCLRGLFGVKKDENRIKQIRKIVIDAYQLSRLAYKQRARFVFSLPKPTRGGDRVFDTHCMQDVYGSNKPEWRGKSVFMAIFPELRKFGDEYGKNMHFENVIFKARVQCVEPTFEVTDHTNCEPATEGRMQESVGKQLQH